jgi:hypothetical protein
LRAGPILKKKISQRKRGERRIKMKKLITTCAALIGAIVVLSFPGISSAQVVVTVPGTSGPWQWNAALNASYPYAEVIPYAFGPTTPPVIVSAANGIPFIPGDVISFNYLSGLAQGGINFPWWDADGDPGSPKMYGAPNYGYSPGYYVPPVGAALVNYMELVGTFADATGAIVGYPCVIGDTATLSIPVGATQFQLGLNDDNYGDNAGMLSIGVSEAPEPCTLALLGLGALGFVRRKK